MPKALVCINTDLFSAEEVLNTIKTCKEVTEAYMVRGIYDIVATVEGKTFNDLVEVINKQINRLQSVHTTTAMMIVEPKNVMQENELLVI